MKTQNIESAVVELFNPFRNIIVPRIKDAANLHHECDLLILHPSGHATEVEIKCSISDLKKDFEKKHNHESSRIRRMFYAVPSSFQGHGAMALIPERCGIIIVHEIPVYRNGKDVIGNDKEVIRYRALIHRQAKARKNALTWTEKEMNGLLKNVHLKFWLNKKDNLIKQ